MIEFGAVALGGFLGFLLIIIANAIFYWWENRKETKLSDKESI